MTISAKKDMALRSFRVQVSRTETLSPHFKRIVFKGEDLEHFGFIGYDQRIKIMFPLADGQSLPEPSFFDTEPDQPMQWYSRWRALPDEGRYPLRTFTVRGERPDQNEIDVDFVVHDHAGPAGRFAVEAKPGDPVIIIGSNRWCPEPPQGFDFRPGGAKRLLIAGDETALPAIASILEGLNQENWEGEGLVVIEVPTSADLIPLEAVDGIHIELLPRQDKVRGRALTDALLGYLERTGHRIEPQLSEEAKNTLEDVDIDNERLWDLPSVTGEGSDGQNNKTYSWIAGEASLVRDLRRTLINDYQMDRNSIAFMGYWRLGRSEIG